jgi:hypothetical protein
MKNENIKQSELLIKLNKHEIHVPKYMRKRTRELLEYVNKTNKTFDEVFIESVKNT